MSVYRTVGPLVWDKLLVVNFSQGNPLTVPYQTEVILLISGGVVIPCNETR